MWVFNKKKRRTIVVSRSVSFFGADPEGSGFVNFPRDVLMPVYHCLKSSTVGKNGEKLNVYIYMCLLASTYDSNQFRTIIDLDNADASWLLHINHFAFRKYAGIRTGYFVLLISDYSFRRRVMAHFRVSELGTIHFDAGLWALGAKPISQ